MSRDIIWPASVDVGRVVTRMLDAPAHTKMSFRKVSSYSVRPDIKYSLDIDRISLELRSQCLLVYNVGLIYPTKYSI